MIYKEAYTKTKIYEQHDPKYPNMYKIHNKKRAHSPQRNIAKA